MKKTSIRKKKHSEKITIKISNKELDALEDFIVCELPEKEKERCRKISLGVWIKMVTAYDKE